MVLLPGQRKLVLCSWALRVGSSCLFSLLGDAAPHGAGQSPALILRLLLLSGLLKSPIFFFFEVCVVSDSIHLRFIQDLAKCDTFCEAVMCLHWHPNLIPHFRTPLPSPRDPPKKSHMEAFNHSFPLVMTLV